MTEFIITEDAEGFITLAVEVDGEFHRIRRDHGDVLIAAHRDRVVSPYNDLLCDVRRLLAEKCEFCAVVYGRGNALEYSAFPVMRDAPGTLLADSVGVYPGNRFSSAARCVLMNTDYIPKDEWESLEGFYTWEDWFAILRMVFFTAV
jgi:hypothetical protein